MYFSINDIFIIVGAIILPQPTYSGPDKVIYFRGVQGLEEELARDKKSTWIIAFYTVWNPACVDFAPVFAKLSSDYYLENLKFGKVDIGRYPDAGQKYKIDDSSLSKQLPTVILFQEGKEVIRRPMTDSKGKFIKFVFSEENIKQVYGLNSLYEKYKSQPRSQNSKAHVD